MRPLLAWGTPAGGPHSAAGARVWWTRRLQQRRPLSGLDPPGLPVQGAGDEGYNALLERRSQLLDMSHGLGGCAHHAGTDTSVQQRDCCWCYLPCSPLTRLWHGQAQVQL